MTTNAIKYTPNGGTVTVTFKRAKPFEIDTSLAKELRKKDNYSFTHADADSLLPEQDMSLDDLDEDRSAAEKAKQKQEAEKKPKTNRVKHDELCLTVEVKDTGMGIAKEEQSKIFRPFYQVSRNSSTGSGLGLTIGK